MNISKKEFEGFLITLPTLQKVAEALGCELVDLENWTTENYQKPLATIQKQFKTKAEANINQSTILSASKSSSMSELAKKTIQTKQLDETQKDIFKEVMKKLRADKRFVGLKPTAQKIVAYYLELKDRKLVSKKAKISDKTINNYLSYDDKTRDSGLAQTLISEYTALEATLAHDEKEQLIRDLKSIKEDSINNREYKTAIDSIKQISVMRGFNAPTEMSVKSVSLSDVLKELKTKKT